MTAPKMATPPSQNPEDAQKVVLEHIPLKDYKEQPCKDDGYGKGKQEHVDEVVLIDVKLPGMPQRQG
jgi:hypothetical protein